MTVDQKWSRPIASLSLNRDKISKIAVPNFTIQELYKRHSLVEETDKVLTSPAKTKDYKKSSNKIEKFCKNY